jgi:hypothetical protein
MIQSSTSTATGWYLPNNADMLTPQGKMLLNLSEKLRTKTGQNQHQHKEVIGIWEYYQIIIELLFYFRS